MKQKILITGASGFIGSTAVERALELGYEVWAGIRCNSSHTYLQDKRIKFIELNYSDKNKLTAQLRKFAEDNGRFHAIIHAAGLTKALHKTDFDKVNYLNVKNFADALVDSDAVPDSFIFLSTLGVIGLGDEKNYTPIPCDAKPNPNTAYGMSKLKAENHLKSIKGFPYVILRPTGVYGPRDKDYLILMRAVKKGLNVGAGFRKQLLTFIYVEDLVTIMFDCIQQKISRKEYNITDGDVYTDTEFNSIVQNALQKKRVVRIKVPLCMVKPAAVLNENIFKLLRKPSTFNSDKYKIMKQRNWTCDISRLKADLNFTPKYQLKEGVNKTVKWYKENGWL